MRSYSRMKPVEDVRIRMSPDLKVQSYSQGPSPQASNLVHFLEVPSSLYSYGKI